MAKAAATTEANRLAFERLTQSDPVLVDVRPVGEFVAGFARNIILTSGPPMAWADYSGGQRDAIIGGALFEGLAKDRDEAIAKLDAGEIEVGACHDFGCVGSLAGIYTASMPAFVVENRAFGNVACCNIYEGSNPRRLNYGVYDDGVRDRLLLVQNEIVPVIAEALRRSGGIPLKPIIKRALGMGDELHSRNTAAALLFLRELVPDLLALASAGSERVVRAVKTMTDDHYFFLRLSMAAAKATADAARDIEGSSVVTAMAFNCRGFSVRVSGLGDTWFKGPHASVEAKLFEGHTEDEITWMGGRKHHRRDDRPWRFRASLGALAADLPGRLLRDDDRAQQGTLRHHGRRESRLSHSGARLSRHADRHRHLQGRGKEGAARPRRRHRRPEWRADRRGRRAAAACMFRESRRGLSPALWLMILRP